MNANRDGMSLNMESFGKILRHLAFYMYCFEFAVESDRKRILFALFLFSQQWTVWKKKENILRVMWQNLELIHSLKHKFVFIILFSMIIHSMGHSFLRFCLDVFTIFHAFFLGKCFIFVEMSNFWVLCTFLGGELFWTFLVIAGWKKSHF